MAGARNGRTFRVMVICTPFTRHRRAAFAAALALTALLPAAPAAAGTLAVPAPAAGDTAVLTGTGAKGVKPNVTAAPKGLVVFGGADRRGRLVVAVARPRGAAEGPARLRARGSLKAKLAASLPASVCKSGGASARLRQVLRRGALKAADARALGAALERRACGRPAATDAALLQRLGLAPPAGAPTPGAGTSAAPVPASSPKPPEVLPPSHPSNPKPPPAEEPGSYGACGDGVDNDGDGQTDALGETGNPDPGCMNENDRTEDSEVTASAACRAVSGVSMNTADPTAAFAAVNAGCGIISEVVVTIQPGIVACDVFTAVVGFVCVNHRGVGRAYNRLFAGPATDIFDMPISLTGAVDCSKPATIALQKPDFTVEEIVEPIAPCPGG